MEDVKSTTFTKDDGLQTFELTDDESEDLTMTLAKSKSVTIKPSCFEKRTKTPSTTRKKHKIVCLRLNRVRAALDITYTNTKSFVYLLFTGAHLHDCSEYTASYADYLFAKDITDWHRIRLAACLEAGVDALVIETIPCQTEAEALVDMLFEDYADVKFWISFQCKDEQTLAHGEIFSESALWGKQYGGVANASLVRKSNYTSV
uniref:Hcy-binding domain-containing protein n=1 Tax=Glossina brevipalpis TaxID=37001 RepID=A0A1A9WJM9_9MUSC